MIIKNLGDVPFADLRGYGKMSKKIVPKLSDSRGPVMALALDTRPFRIGPTALD